MTLDELKRKWAERIAERIWNLEGLEPDETIGGETEEECAEASRKVMRGVPTVAKDMW